jgi:beta-lactamase regulating signal transducer with metallopeptidase domain
MTWTLLLSLLAKSSLVAGAGLLCARFLTRRPVERVDILRATVCLLLALPAIMNMLPPLELALLPALSVEAAPAPTAALPLPPADTPVTSVWTSPGAVLGGLWLLGAALIGARLALGLRTLERWTRKGQPVTEPVWLAPLEDLPAIDRPGVIGSDRVAGPLSWGVAPGTILLDPATLAQPHAAPAIMAHELAHLRRHDWIFLILSRLALAIFWFNPLVWRLHTALAERAEEAADAAAVGSVDRTLYARTLVRLASTPVPVGAATPSLALPMAADAKTLKTRIACIMTDTPERRRPLTVGLTVAALAVVATPLAAFGLSRQVAPPVPPAPPAAIAQAPLPPAPPAEAAAAAPPAAPAPPAPPAPAAGMDADRYERIQARAQAEWDRNQAHAQAEWTRAQAEAVRVNAEDVRRIAEDARREVEAHRGEIEATARQAAEQARLSAEDARRIGEEARRAGERARVDAMKVARVQMAQGAVQMRAGARQMREEAARLGDPAYRARQIADNRARGNTVSDQELQDLARRLPGQADDLDREADKLAQKSRNMS